MSKKRPGHRSNRARSKAQKSEDEKLFLKLLQDYERKTSGKKTVTKAGGGGKRINRASNSDRKETPPASGAKGKKSNQKIGTDNSAKVSKVRAVTRQKTTSKGTGKTSSGKLVIEKRQRGKEQTDFEFSGVRSVDKKINLFKEQAGKAIKNQLRRKGGKPPRGIIVTVRDKKGREHTRMSPLDFVVNADSVQEFVDQMLADMRDDFMEWKDMQDEPADDTDSNPYADFNPDTIHEITIKYIY